MPHICRDRREKKLVTCDVQRCPYAAVEQTYSGVHAYVNRAPYFGVEGMTAQTAQGHHHVGATLHKGGCSRIEIWWPTFGSRCCLRGYFNSEQPCHNKATTGSIANNQWPSTSILASLQCSCVRHVISA
eukprot:320552-Chlamydomonas_euryale.AAC.12